MKNFLFFVCFFTMCIRSHAQDTTIINSYAAAWSYTPCISLLTVDATTDFYVGDKILVIQMKGLFIDSSNTSAFGNATQWNSLGNYEVNEIKSIIGNSFILKYELVRSYEFISGRVQVVKIPSYNNYDISKPHTCKSWNGLKGGIFAISVTGNLTMHNDINVTGKGFKGGITDTIYSGGAPKSQTDYCYVHVKDYGGMKGEGVTEVSPRLLNCRGPLFNGGGGGNNPNSGGGGGGNGGQGGKGGNEWTPTPMSYAINGGIGGHQFNYSAKANNIYMAGGGGAGNENDGNKVHGGAGGGIIFVLADKIVGNNNSMITNGDTGLSCLNYYGCNDGMGGGGGGGTILINANSVSDISFSACGGNGGSMVTSSSEHGPGGGGGGGAVLFNNMTSTSTVEIKVSAGLSGTYSSKGPTTNYGAANGESGVTISSFQPFIDTVISSAATITKVTDVAICDEDSFTLDGPPDCILYVWNTDERTSSISSSLAGKYICHAVSECQEIISTYNVTISSCNIKVPTAFSPNADGQNDILYIRGKDIKEIDFRIFNRFGQQIFETKDLSKGWDGTYHGKPQPIESYGYSLKATFTNNKTNFFKGNVTLLR